MTAPGERLLTMGRLGGPFGVRGWLKVHSYTSPPENILRYSPWWVRLGDDWTRLEVRDGRAHGKGLVAQLEGYEDREAVRPLVGADVAVERSRLEVPGEGEYYWADLIGVQVVDRSGGVLGRVDHLIDAGVHDVLVIRDEGGRECLVPFVPDRIILEVDLEGGRIVADWQQDY